MGNGQGTVADMMNRILNKCSFNYQEMSLRGSLQKIRRVDMDTLTKNRIRNQEEERIANEEAAERYYRFLSTAVKQGDWKNMKKDPPEEIDWSSLRSEERRGRKE